MQVIGYTRVSTDKQDMSPGDQRAAIERWCREHGRALVRVFDEEVSGGAELATRLVLMEAIEALGPGMALVVTKRDRLAREVYAAAMIEREVAKRGASVVTVDGVGNGGSPEAKLLRQMVDAFAEYERALIALRTRNAMRLKRERGEKLGGRTPYGMTLAADGKTLVTDETEQKLLRRIRRMHHERGMSIRAITAKLAGEGVTSRSGSPISKSTIDRLLHQKTPSAGSRKATE